MERAVLRVVAYAVVQEQRLLTVRKRHTQMFMFPGGKLEPGESHEAAVRREVQEELSCAIDVASCRLLGQFTTAAANEPDTDLIATVFSGGLIGSPIASGEIAELRWISIANFEAEEDLAPLLRDCVLPQLRQQHP